MPINPSMKHLSADEARRALYIDAEGVADEIPVLLGVHRRGRGARPFVSWDLLDETLSPLGSRITTFEGAIRNVVRRAEHADRRIVAWSTHELDLVHEHLAHDPELVARFEARFVNAKLLAERWRSKCHAGAKPASGSLRDYLELIGYDVPEDAPYGEAAETIRRVRHALERNGTLTVKQLERWVRLLEHNRFDCAGMRAVCLRAAQEIDAADAPPAG